MPTGTRSSIGANSATIPDSDGVGTMPVYSVALIFGRIRSDENQAVVRIAIGTADVAGPRNRAKTPYRHMHVEGEDIVVIAAHLVEQGPACTDTTSSSTSVVNTSIMRWYFGPTLRPDRR